MLNIPYNIFTVNGSGEIFAGHPCTSDALPFGGQTLRLDPHGPSLSEGHLVKASYVGRDRLGAPQPGSYLYFLDGLGGEPRNGGTSDLFHRIQAGEPTLVGNPAVGTFAVQCSHGDFVEVFPQSAAPSLRRMVLGVYDGQPIWGTLSEYLGFAGAQSMTAADLRCKFARTFTVRFPLPGGKPTVAPGLWNHHGPFGGSFRIGSDDAGSEGFRGIHVFDGAPAGNLNGVALYRQRQYNAAGATLLAKDPDAILVHLVVIGISHHPKAYSHFTGESATVLVSTPSLHGSVPCLEYLVLLKTAGILRLLENETPKLTLGVKSDFTPNVRRLNAGDRGE